MKINIYISVLLVFLCFAKVNAQVPGYLGKRFLVGYELTSMYNLVYPNANMQTGIVSFSVLNSIKAEYVIARATSIGFSATYGRTGCHGDYTGTNGSSYYGESFEQGGKTLNIIESGLFLNLFKYGKRGAIAPLGSYGTIGVNYFSYTPSTPSGTVLKDPSLDHSYWKRLHGTHIYFSLGRRWLINDRFMPSVSVTTGLYATSYLFNPERNTNNYGYYYYSAPTSSTPSVENEKSYRNYSSQRMALLGVVQFNIGLSYLIF